MFTTNQIQEGIKEYESRLRESYKIIEEHTAVVQSLERWLNHLKDMQDLPKVPMRTDKFDVSEKPQWKTNVQLYEHILNLKGHPMHITDLLEAALSFGLKQKGTADPVRQLRNSLNSTKRIVKVGKGKWWIAEKPLPEGYH